MSIAYGLRQRHMRAKAAAQIPRETNYAQFLWRRQCKVARCTKNINCVTCKLFVFGKCVKQVKEANIYVDC